MSFSLPIPYTRKRVVPDPGTVSRTKQSFRDPSDVNAIMRKYLTTGFVDWQNRGVGRYGDFTSGLDYFESLSRVVDAQRRFMELPSHVRQHFGNDPGNLLAAAHDPARIDELVKLGLVSNVADPPATKSPAPILPAAGTPPGNAPEPSPAAPGSTNGS